ncbi:MAG: hypothetical protein BWY72_01522 [Bacteroidetes bacterium ADurb.Bin416]|nr:MAG: hypothetical protein BWY72_01522 [Bacteroidetes bacterium ADurb.Bin416]
MYHGGLNKYQFFAVTYGNSIACFDGYQVPVFPVKQTPQGLHTIFRAINRGAGYQIQQLSQGTTVIWFGMIDHDKIDGLDINFRGQVFDKFMGEGFIYRVDQTGLFLQNEVGIIRGTTGSGVFGTVKFTQIPVVFTHPIYVILNRFLHAD